MINKTKSATIPHYAGFWIRFWASIIDTILLLFIIIPLLLTIYGQQFLESFNIVLGPADLVISYLFPIIAVIAFWIYKSATPGKLMFRLKIVDATSLEKPTHRQFITRYLGYFVSTIPLCLGFLWVAFDARKQGWHDKLANTLVIIEPKQ